MNRIIFDELAFEPIGASVGLTEIEGTPVIRVVKPEENTEPDVATYARLIDFFDRNGFVMGPLAYEEYLRNELTASSDEDYLTRIVIQVARVRP